MCLHQRKLCLEFCDPLLGILFSNHAPDHKIDGALPFAFYPIALALQRCAYRVRLCRQFSALLVVFSYVCLDQVGRVQLLAHAVEDSLLDLG
ncbi:hypothetical protein [Mesorhizobium sp. CA16]|uniref:hypothetical protein n=1 Tax=Mesorhizobium sp. CA16 TaxID=588496 RepID=UPI001CCC1EE9|nr:hypothetical protein [Mesorhizobium sp. CA16]MBZ9910982.1 hypothetical protein [Mesorhizobium sp. CA16]